MNQIISGCDNSISTISSSTLTSAWNSIEASVSSRKPDRDYTNGYEDYNAPRKVEIFLFDGHTLEAISTRCECADAFNPSIFCCKVGEYIFGSKQIKYIKLGPTLLDDLADKQ